MTLLQYVDLSYYLSIYRSIDLSIYLSVYISSCFCLNTTMNTQCVRLQISVSATHPASLLLARQALYNLGCCYMNGTGVPRDPPAAVDCYRRAADKGDMDAHATWIQFGALGCQGCSCNLWPLQPPTPKRYASSFLSLLR